MRDPRFSPEELLRRRKAAGFSQRQLAHLVGVTEWTLLLWEKGAHTPRYWNVVRLAEALDCQYEDFLPKDVLQGSPATRGTRGEVLA